jgi:tRNA threonylcarbamoyladenosine biosynthesis protein TsaE
LYRVETSSPDETLEYAGRIGRRLHAGDVVLLKGGLGAGKTQFVKGLAIGMGFSGVVTSPTFTLMQVYPGHIPLYHFDLYRLRSSSELEGIGFEEYIGRDGVAVVEWPDLFPDEMPDDCLMIDIEKGEGPEKRVFLIQPHGAEYLKRFDGRDEF